MAKRRSWFGWIKRLFICEAKAKSVKKLKKLRRVFRRLKLRQKPVVAAVQECTTLGEATEEQRKHALNVAIATAAAAEAAVAAARAAAEVVRLAGNAFMSQHYSKKPDLNLAAIKIQSAYRAYLARKALRALKALVRLQAIVRGRAVRRKVFASLKSLRSNAQLQLEAQEEEDVSTGDIIQKYKERKHWTKPRWEVKKELKLECSSQNSWDCSALTEEDIKAIWLRKKEGIIKRERMLRYSHSHRERRTPHMLLESIYTKEMGMRSCRLEHWGEPKSLKSKNSALTACEIHIPSQVKLKNLQRQRQDSIDGQYSPSSFPRRSFSCAEQSLLEDGSLVLNPRVLPPYMAATESAKAKIRSLSTLRQHAGFMDSWLDNKRSAGYGVSHLWSSFDGENTKINNNSQRLLSGSLNLHC